LALLAGVGASPARAAEVQLLSAAAMQSVFKEIAGEFERASGHKLIIRYATMGAITSRVLGGETPDLVIGSTQSISSLVSEGRIRPDSQLTICKTGVGIVTPVTAPKLEIADVDDFKRALLAAKVIVYADPAGGGAAGIHIANVLRRLGIARRLARRTTFGAGGDVTEVTLAQGDGALGMTQISEIVGKSDARFVGPLPGDLQNYTGVTAGIPIGMPRSPAVTAFVDFMRSPTAIAALQAKGMEVDRAANAATPEEKTTDGTAR
jgi:molybdate transport system substrate-binding protein